MIITNRIQVLKDIIAKTLRTYIDYEYIDFVKRSNASKGTITWSEYVAEYLLKSPEFMTYVLDKTVDTTRRLYNE